MDAVVSTALSQMVDVSMQVAGLICLLALLWGW